MNDSSPRMTYPERKVAEYLQKMNIEWVYEQPVFIWDDDGRPRVWTSDFSFFTLVSMLKYAVLRCSIMSIDGVSFIRTSTA